MERAMPAAKQASATRPERAGGLTSAEPAITDLRPSAGHQREIVEAAERSPQAAEQRRLSATARDSARSVAQRQLSADIHGGPRSVTQRAMIDASFGPAAPAGPRRSDEVAQRIQIGEDPPLSFPDTLALVKEALGGGIDDKVLGRLVRALHKDNEPAYLTREVAIAYVQSVAAGYQAVLAGSKAADALGDQTEVAAAAIIRGVVNRKNGRDVEWRMMAREDAELLKVDMKIGPGPGTDQDLFASWKAVLKKFPAYNKVHSTPVDAYSATTLALAGGAAKFKPGTSELTATAAIRVNQLIELASMLGYDVRLVFSKSATCEQCEQVASDYRIDVEHLEEI